MISHCSPSFYVLIEKGPERPVLQEASLLVEGQSWQENPGSMTLIQRPATCSLPTGKPEVRAGRDSGAPAGTGCRHVGREC